MEFSLDSHCHQDIENDSFQNGPLKFDLGARVAAVLRAECLPDHTRYDHVRPEGDLLLVGPGLIRRRQVIQFKVLVDGSSPRLTPGTVELRNVDLRQRSAEPKRLKVKLPQLAMAATGVAVAVAAFLIGTNTAISHAGTNRAEQAAEQVEAAGGHLDSPSMSTRINAIHSLRQLMSSYPAQQAAVVTDLTGFIQRQSRAGSNDQPVTADVQSALNVLVHRNPARDNDVAIDLSNANLTQGDLTGGDFSGANFSNADLSDANLTHANLRAGDLDNAYLGGANLIGAGLSETSLSGTSFANTPWCHGSTPANPKEGYNCTQ